MRSGTPGHRHPAGGGSTTFLSLTSWSRPSFTAARTVNFTSRSGLDTALANLLPGDLIQYTGTGAYPITSASASPAYTISGKNPAGAGAVIDFGTSASVWAPGNISGNYVAFSTTYGSQSSCVVVKNCSNIQIFGGDITSQKGYGVEIDGPCTNVTWWDAYIHHVGSSGLWVRDYVGANTYVRNCNFRMEVNRFCMNPAIDSHQDHGSGHHGFLLHGNTGETSGNTFTAYAHDPLLPGETSFGTVWPEGSGGSGVEIGHDGSGSYSNNTYYIKGVNLLMIPDGTNPGSTASQFGGCVAALYGNGPLNNNVFCWIEGTNCTGAVIHCAPTGAYDSVTTPIVVNHGRHSNVNQYTANSSMGSATGNNVPYNLGHGIVYHDAT